MVMSFMKTFINAAKKGINLPANYIEEKKKELEINQKTYEEIKEFQFHIDKVNLELFNLSGNSIDGFTAISKDYLDDNQKKSILRSLAYDDYTTFKKDTEISNKSLEDYTTDLYQLIDKPLRKSIESHIEELERQKEIKQKIANENPDYNKDKLTDLLNKIVSEVGPKNLEIYKMTHEKDISNEESITEYLKEKEGSFYIVDLEEKIEEEIKRKRNEDFYGMKPK